MIDPARALELLAGDCRPRGTEVVPLGRALGRVLAQAVVADRDFPPADRSAMDGFALRSADARSPGSRLRIVGEVRAGRPVGEVRVGPGEAARIMTGAVLPEGADCVVMVEKTAEDASGGTVRVDDVPGAGQHVRRRAGELARGDAVLEPGTLVRPAEIAALASVGTVAVPVFERPRAGVLSTGDEIVEPDRMPEPHEVRNSNAHALLAQLEETGVEGRYLGIARDEPGDLDRALADGLSADVLLVSGGVSAGKYDLVGAALAAAGVRELFHGVSIKPGKPLLAGRRGACLVVGCPGNPVSTFVVFAVLVAPALRKMAGRADWRNRFLAASLDEPLRAAAGRETYHLALLAAGAAGLTARPIPSSGSGDVLALARATGLVVTGAEGADLPAGAAVRVLALRGGGP
jgi:molybdopterin molybdotransferase